MASIRHVNGMLETWPDLLHVLGSGGVTTILLCVGYGLVKLAIWILEG